MTDAWEEGFDSWTPRGREGAPDDTFVDLDREALLRLARELAEKRHAEHEQANAELEQLKQTLRERAAAIAERERELAGVAAPPASADADALLARERAALERAQAVETRERELAERLAELEAERERVEARERELAKRLAEAEAEQRLAAVERERLDERERAAHAVEKELAALRIELERNRRPAVPAAAPPQADHRERELRRLEARLETREAELALMRQGLDAERIALSDRERALRRREAADVRHSFEPPLAPPGFGEGLAAFVRSRSRGE